MAPGDESSTLEIMPAAGLRSARPRAPRFPLLYQLMRGACAPVLRRLFGLEISGLERVPTDGPFILAANHHNYLDGVVLGVAVPRPISFLVMPRVFHASPLHPSFHRRIGSIRVSLGRPDPGAMKRSLRVLEEGGVVGIFPEGPFSREGRLVPGPLRPPAVLPSAPSRHPCRARRDHPPHHGSHRGAPPRRPSRRIPARRSRRFVTDTSGNPGSSKPWGGRFSTSADPAAEAFTASLAFDRRLWPHDIRGSIAWAHALERAGLIDKAECGAIEHGLGLVRAELESGRFAFRRELEDIHMNIERRLIELVGPVGGKLHTGRSRNDQIALDERLYVREVLGDLDAALVAVQSALLDQAERHRTAAMPGYTHLQRAQPVLLAHHLLAYVAMLDRDRGRFADCARRVNVLPLGSAALAGAAFAIDREALAHELGFDVPSANSMDAVADRDYIVEALAAAAVLGMHCSRLAADLTLWATAEFGFVEFADAFATGSSIMPQKKNPDVAELIRGKTGRLYGNLMAVLSVMKGLPLTYNSDMQEDKEPFFDTIDTLEAILRVLPPMLGSLTFRVERMREAAGADYSTATDLADYLVRKGLPFREAHEIVGRVVREAIARGQELVDLALDELRRFSPLIDTDVFAALTVESSLRARLVTGGTAPEAVEQALAQARARITRAPAR